ncbi:hypothetical protein [Yinghuangia seranimata]|uniref:hypothetical protein n=1 Tax=Yinghuangia seranimata TaxID=408067 RepID=UPI00248C5486|nr:hypothetical protein [Yinghuangia seranimata]MDI2125800.1 hypothetical protein [Yinghuangia seranimata]
MPDAPHSHHWIITVQWADTIASYRGTLTPPPGRTRAEVCEEVLAHAMTSAGRTDEPSLLFFALERNALDENGNGLSGMFRDRKR